MGDPQKGAKYQSFFVINTTHRFDHFCFTDFLVTWQEYVNPVPVNTFLAKF